ncbi:MAG: ATP-binding protein, partial [Myxococcota bacterium]
VSRAEVERGFEQRIERAIQGARRELVWEATTMDEVLIPLCEHDSFVDQTLLDLERVKGRVDRLSPGRSIALKELVPDQARALRLDHLTLLSGDGYVLGASDASLRGSRSGALAQRLGEPKRTRLVTRGGVPHLEVHCRRRRGDYAVGLIAGRKVEDILHRVGSTAGVALALHREDLPQDGPGYLTRRLVIDAIEGLEVHAAISRQPLFEALAQIDSSMLLTGAMAVLLSVALAVLVARGLSQPIVELARQSRAVVRGSPHPVVGRGSREIRQLARSFNRTLEELSAMRERLARTERIAARREVARQVAHEIKNPLAPIRGAVENLRRLRERDSPKFDEYFDEATITVLSEVHRIKTIVDEFTKFARMPPPQFEAVDVVEVAERVATLHRTDAEITGERQEVAVHPLTPPPVVTADRDQLVQVLTNLVQNGLEAARELHDRSPRVEVSFEAAGEREVLVIVDDNGPGVAADLRPRLFEPYVSSKAEGTGLGLAIVQTIVHEHGGEIACAAAPSPLGGARFVITLVVDGPPMLLAQPHSDLG